MWGCMCLTTKPSTVPHGQLYGNHVELVSLGFCGEAVGFPLLRLIRQLGGFAEEVPIKALKLRERCCLPRLNISQNVGMDMQIPHLKSRLTIYPKDVPVGKRLASERYKGDG